MLKELLKPEIKELINNRKWNDLKEALRNWPSPEVAELLLDIDKYNRVLLFRALPRDLSADVFSYLDYDEREELLYDLTDQETRELLSDMSPDDRTALLEELPSKVTRTMLNLLNPQDLKEARQLLGYPEDSIGRIMTPDFVAVRPQWTVAEALSHIKRFGKDSETVNRVYVTDKSGKLLDDILLRQIILSDDEQTIENLMDYNVISVSAFEDQEETVRLLEKYDVVAIPVVDSEGQLVGIVTFDDIFDVYEEEQTEDFQKISGINPVDQTYLSASVWRLWSKRFPWLLTLLLANFLTAAVISNYHHVLAAVVALTSFIPLLIGTAGNSGTQSATLIIRSLATGEVEIADWFRVILKEIAVGLLLGIALGIIAYLAGFIEGKNSVGIAVTVSLSMVILIIWANLIGSILPIVLAKIKLDPAVISSPLIATLIDVTGIIVYINIAIMVLEI